MYKLSLEFQRMEPQRRSWVHVKVANSGIAIVVVKVLEVMVGELTEIVVTVVYVVTDSKVVVIVTVAVTVVTPLRSTVYAFLPPFSTRDPHSIQ